MNKQHKQRKTNGDSLEMYGESEYPVFGTQRVSTDYNIFIDSTLTSPQEMRLAVQAMMTAQPEDNITVHINSYGGCVDSGQTFLNATRYCNAPIHMIASGSICSMAAIILSCADSFSIDPFASVMFHSVSFSTGGPAHDVVSYSQFTKKRAESLMSFCCIGILTAQELEDIFERKREIWLDAQQFTDRFRRKLKAQEQLQNTVEQAGLDMADITPEMFVELMIEEMDNLQEDDEPLEEQNLEDMSIEDLETLADQVNELLLEKYEERDTLEEDTEEFVQDGLKMDEQY